MNEVQCPKCGARFRGTDPEARLAHHIDGCICLHRQLVSAKKHIAKLEAEIERLHYELLEEPGP